jgi:hypothetical protein
MLSLEEHKLIRQIADRASRLYDGIGTKVAPIYIEAEISYVHVHVCPLRLKEFAEADGANFAHDIVGIHRHLNMSRNVLEDCFLPRFADIRGGSDATRH